MSAVDDLARQFFDDWQINDFKAEDMIRAAMKRADDAAYKRGLTDGYRAKQQFAPEKSA